MDEEKEWVDINNNGENDKAIEYDYDSLENWYFNIEV